MIRNESLVMSKRFAWPKKWNGRYGILYIKDVIRNQWSSRLKVIRTLSLGAFGWLLEFTLRTDIRLLSIKLSRFEEGDEP